jgi:lipopolysaccharide biosynthesis glycosyltransferase
MSILDVGCAVEGEYVAHSAAMLRSVLQQSEDYRVRVHYIHGPELPGESKRPLAEMIEREGGEVVFVEVPDYLCAGLPTEGFTRKATWYRIFVPDLLPELDRILLLDADLLAVDSLGPLWETEVSEHYLAAVTNVFQADHLFRPAELGFDRPETYFNAGVMLMNLQLIRRDGRTAVLRDYGAEHAAELMFRDQDALNVVLAGRRRPLHPRWNSMNSLAAFPWSAYVFGARAVEEATRNPGIRHFEGPGPNKPWHRGCEAALRELYFEHRRHTPWPEVRMEGEPPPSPGVARRLARRVGRRLKA